MPGNSDEVVLTMERKGLSNGYCVCCFSCCTNCNDNFAVYEGNVEGSPGSLENAPKMHTMIEQPCGGGIFTPTIDIKPQAGGFTPMRIKGPYIFGGCSEICCDQNFRVYGKDSGEEMGSIKHKTPEDCCELCLAFCSTIDRYEVQFKEKPVSAEDKTNVLLSSFLVDYMFYEMDEGPCYCTNKSIVITLFFCNCFGCLCPCQIRLRRGGGDEEGEGGEGGGLEAALGAGGFFGGGDDREGDE